MQTWAFNISILTGFAYKMNVIVFQDFHILLTNYSTYIFLKIPRQKKSLKFRFLYTMTHFFLPNVWDFF